MSEKRLKVKLIKSVHGRLKNHRLCVQGLGLRGINSVAYVKDTQENRGMINKINYMLEVEENA